MYHFTKESKNVKIGKIPCTVSSADTCPNTCPHKGHGCYGETGPASWHWSKVTTGQRGADWQTLLHNINKIPDGQLWRHNVTGDLNHDDGIIDRDTLHDLIDINKGKRGFTYTHHALVGMHNISLLQYSNRHGFTVNISCETYRKADSAIKAGLPAVVTLPHDTPTNFTHTTPNGNKVIVCPNQKGKKATCANCGLCQKRPNNIIIGFIAHGARKAKVKTA